MDTPQVDDFLMWAAGVVGAVVVITGGLLAVYRGLTATIYKRFEAVDKQLSRNGGSSLRDAVDRIEEKQTDMAKLLQRTGERLDQHIDYHLDKEL